VCQFMDGVPWSNIWVHHRPSDRSRDTEGHLHKPPGEVSACGFEKCMVLYTLVANVVHFLLVLGFFFQGIQISFFLGKNTETDGSRRTPLQFFAILKS
jgi:hypothetical protein